MKSILGHFLYFLMKRTVQQIKATYFLLKFHQVLINNKMSFLKDLKLVSSMTSMHFYVTNQNFNVFFGFFFLCICFLLLLCLFVSRLFSHLRKNIYRLVYCYCPCGGNPHPEISFKRTIYWCFFVKRTMCLSQRFSSNSLM